MRWLLILLIALVPLTAKAEPLRVFAAASMTEALTQAGAAYTRKTGRQLSFSFASSAAGARQIEQGAPADIFVSADAQWMDYLADKALLRVDTRRDIAGNRLVLVAPVASEIAQRRLDRRLPLARLLGPQGRLAIADPSSVPAGRYAQQALTALGLWDYVQNRLARTDTVRSALLFVSRGEAPLGIVYATDARIDKGVKVIGVFPARSHEPIRYPAALTRDAAPEAAAFLAFLSSGAGRAILKANGFLPVR